MKYHKPSFELLDDVVMVEGEGKDARGSIGVTSVAISYEEFIEQLKEVKKGGRKEQKDSDYAQLIQEWGRNGKVEFPVGVVSLEMDVTGNLYISQMVGGNGSALLKCKGKELDTSRVLVSYKVNKRTRELEDVTASIFKGLMYGFHKKEDIQPQEFLTLKAKLILEGVKVRNIKDISARDAVQNIHKEDLLRTGDTLKGEIVRVLKDGGAIRWGEVKLC